MVVEAGTKPALRRLHPRGDHRRDPQRDLRPRRSRPRHDAAGPFGGRQLAEREGDRFRTFSRLHQLLPEVDSRYRWGRPRILIGHSSGEAHRHVRGRPQRSNTFPIVVPIEAPIHLGDHSAGTASDRASASKGGRSPVRYGVASEARFGWYDRRWTELTAASPSAWVLEREKLRAESHESMAFLATYPWAQARLPRLLDCRCVDPLRGMASAAVQQRTAGSRRPSIPRLPPPGPVLRRLIRGPLDPGPSRARAARPGSAGRGYGRQDETELESMIAHAAVLPPLEESIGYLNAAPMPASQEIAPFVAEVEGSGVDESRGQVGRGSHGLTTGRRLARSAPRRVDSRCSSGSGRGPRRSP